MLFAAEADKRRCKSCGETGVKSPSNFADITVLETVFDDSPQRGTKIQFILGKRKFVSFQNRRLGCHLLDRDGGLPFKCNFAHKAEEGSNGIEEPPNGSRGKATRVAPDKFKRLGV